MVLAHHLAPAPWWYCGTITNPPRRGFPAPSLTCLTLVFLHHSPPPRSWFSTTIAHLSGWLSNTMADPPGRGLPAPLFTYPTAVFVHHRVPTHWWSSCAIILLSNSGFLYTTAHPPHGGFYAPSPSCPAPIQRWFLHTITHPSNRGFHIPSPSCPAVIFAHQRAPTQRRFSYTRAHPTNGGFHTPSPSCPAVVLAHHRAPAQRQVFYTVAHLLVWWVIHCRMPCHLLPPMVSDLGHHPSYVRCSSAVALWYFSVQMHSISAHHIYLTVYLYCCTSLHLFSIASSHLASHPVPIKAPSGSITV